MGLALLTASVRGLLALSNCPKEKKHVCGQAKLEQ